MPRGAVSHCPLGMYLRRTSRARYALRRSRPTQVFQVGVQILFILLERHPVHATGCVLPPTRVKTQAQNVLVEPPIQVSEAVVLVLECLLGYGPQEGLPVWLRVFLRRWFACADCVVTCVAGLLTASGLAPCGWILWANPTPGGSAARLVVAPAPSCLALAVSVRQGLSGPPRFRATPSARATL